MPFLSSASPNGSPKISPLTRVTSTYAVRPTNTTLTGPPISVANAFVGLGGATSPGSRATRSASSVLMPVAGSTSTRPGVLNSGIGRSCAGGCPST